MSFEKYDLEEITKERRQAIAKSIHPISADELKKLADEIFKYADDPWREAVLNFIAEHPGASFHHAVTQDGVNVVYSRENDKGMWFLPGQAKGPLQESGRKTMREIIEHQH